MRIISGEFRSRRLDTLKGNNTRPTLDKVREAVFSSIGGYFDGGLGLDLYAGSGACGLEGLSRGLDEVYLNDIAKDAVSIIRKNVDTLKVQDRVHVSNMSEFRLLSLLKQQGKQFSFVYVDPPYKKEKNEKVLKRLVDDGLLQPNAIVIVESLKEESFSPSIESLTLYKEAIYGITKISYYRNEVKE